MSTRSCIARVKGDGFAGTYHHWDGNPIALGATLYAMAQERPLPEMLKLLIDDHPAGWSTINGADWSQEPGFREGGFDNGDGAECYCHGGRSEEANLVTHESDMGMEWAYVFDESAHTMAVCERVYGDGIHATGFFGTLGSDLGHWAVRAVVPLSSLEPDWETIEA